MSLRVLDPGLCTLIVDRGRLGWRSLGVPVGGAADTISLAIGNALVGNPAGAAALEVCLAGPTLQANCELACVVHGAPFALHVDRQAERNALAVGKTFTLFPEDILHVGGTHEGMRAYFCVDGGIEAKEILGSRSGREPLQADQDLACTPSSIRSRFVRFPQTWGSGPQTIRVMLGLQSDWFRMDDFFRNEYAVTSASNRMGLRLKGEPLLLLENGKAKNGPDTMRELVSEPVCPGAIQATRDGQCIILGVDGQTIGGYPKVAHVIRADLDKLGQLRPGQAVRFIEVILEEAEALYRKQRVELEECLTRLEITRSLVTESRI